MSSRPSPVPPAPPTNSRPPLNNSTLRNSTSNNSTPPTNRTISKNPAAKPAVSDPFEITPPIVIAVCLAFLLISGYSFCYGYRCYSSRKKRRREKQSQMLVSTDQVDKLLPDADTQPGEFINSGAKVDFSPSNSTNFIKGEKPNGEIFIPLAPPLQQSSSLPHNPSPLRHSNNHQQPMSLTSSVNNSSRLRHSRLEEEDSASFINQHSFLHHSRSQPASLHPALTPPLVGVRNGNSSSFSESSSFDHNEEDVNSSTKRLNRSFNKSPPSIGSGVRKSTPRGSSDKRNTFGGFGEIENLPSAVIGVSISRDMLEQALGGSTVPRTGKSRNNSRPNSRPASRPSSSNGGNGGSRPGSRDGFVYESKRTPKLERKSIIISNPPPASSTVPSSPAKMRSEEVEEEANVLSFNHMAMPNIQPIQIGSADDWGLDGYFAELNNSANRKK